MQADGKIAAVYAGALFELAVEKNQLEEFEEELRSLGQALQADGRVWEFLKSPVGDIEDRERLIARALKDRISVLNYYFIGTLIRRRRLAELPGAIKVFRRLVDEKLGRKHVRVRSARQLNEVNLRQIEKALADFFKKTIILETEIKPDLIGGLRIRAGDLVLDTSLKSRLRRIKKQMAERKIFGEKYYEN